MHVKPPARAHTAAPHGGSHCHQLHVLLTLQVLWHRPVDIIAVNSLELPPYSGCGAAMRAGSPSGYGCGRLLVDGVQVAATSTRWQTHEAGRRSAPLPGSGVTQGSRIWGQNSFPAPGKE